MRTRQALILAAAGAGFVLAGCATLPAATSPDDPWERVNRTTFRFNESLDRALLKPVATGYRRAVPGPVRSAVTNFLSNLAYPVTIANDLLQFKLRDTLSDTTRFVLNSTLGLGGLLDPATDAGLARNDEDFGQTLGRWGLPPGPYVMVPFLGPSTLRDAPAGYVDYLANPRRFIDDRDTELALTALSIVDDRTRLFAVEEVLEGAFDRYALLRNAFLQRREYQVRDGDVPEEPLDELLVPEDAGPQ